MHVIVLENQPSSTRGGQELNLIEITRGLSDRGHEVSLVYIQEGDLISEYQKFCDSINRINRYGFDRRKFNQIIDFFSSLAVLTNIPATKNSVVFSNDYHFAFFGYLLALAKNIPFVCYLQIPPLHFNTQRMMGLKGAKKYIAVSNKTKSDWVNLNLKEEKIDVVYNGTNTDRFNIAQDFASLRRSWNIPENTRVISFVGRLDPEKGLESLIKAFALVVKNGKKAKLLIAGRPVVHFSDLGKECSDIGEKYKQSLEQLATHLGVRERVEFLGHVSNTDAVYQVSDITVLPSLWSEPFGRVIIEAMACGTPVVGSRIGGIPEILTGEFQNGLFDAGDEKSLSETLSRIIDWRDENPQLGERCRQHILANFSIDSMVNGVEKVLVDVVNEGKNLPVKTALKVGIAPFLLFNSNF